MRIAVLCLLLLLAACTESIPAPTPTRYGADAPTLAPSPVIYPVIGTQPANDFVGRNNPTAAALAAEGHPTDDPITAPAPTDSIIPITVYASDGVLLRASFYGAPVQPAPALLLLHGEDGAITELDQIAQILNESGYNVMVLALRGYQLSTGKVDWSRSIDDVMMALDTLSTLPNVMKIATLGKGTGAVAGSIACEQHVNCITAVALDPMFREDMPPLEEVAELQLPLLILVNETHDVRIDQVLRPTKHSLEVYSTASSRTESVLRWLETHFA